ncbi:tartronate semialdehyde reductase [uncultured Alphaproteobacteria bacterium]|uniref:Tartronate semialdehyde reductase n=1 Tax=uncultured Alphaproteobacteria bacterium TaxID=91750 RepID=A0A212KMD0_9PROT|nr:tartronate semialdehyde reductase [uncultured Alphaproteobacteria bacterium]
MELGFIGLGIMGKPMVKNLLKAGHKVLCFDLNADSVKSCTAAGATAAASIAEVARRSAFIITMLPNSPQVSAVALGPGGIAENAKPGTLLVDMSSIAPLAAREIHDHLRAKGIRMLDSPVSGGEPKAVDGTLSVMIGGAQADFDEAAPVLEAMAGSVVRVGEIGAGNIAKLANQICVAVNIAGLAEAMALSAKAGVDPALVYQAIRGGLAGSTVMDAKAPMMLDRNIKPGFKVNLHVKDLGNIIETGHGVGVPLPMSAAVMEMMQALKVDGMGDADHSALVRYYEKLSNCEVKRV